MMLKKRKNKPNILKIIFQVGFVIDIFPILPYDNAPQR